LTRTHCSHWSWALTAPLSWRHSSMKLLYYKVYLYIPRISVWQLVRGNLTQPTAPTDHHTGLACAWYFLQGNVRVSSSNKIDCVQCIEKRRKWSRWRINHMLLVYGNIAGYRTEMRQLPIDRVELPWPKAMMEFFRWQSVHWLRWLVLMRFTAQNNDKGNCKNDCCRSWIVVAERAELVACPTGPRMKRYENKPLSGLKRGSDNLCPWWVELASGLVHGFDRYYPSYYHHSRDRKGASHHCDQ
jgi:hypothetical protein